MDNKEYRKLFFGSKGKRTLEIKENAKLLLDNGYPLENMLKDFDVTDEIFQLILARKACIAKN